MWPDQTSFTQNVFLQQYRVSTIEREICKNTHSYNEFCIEVIRFQLNSLVLFYLSFLLDHHFPVHLLGNVIMISHCSAFQNLVTIQSYSAKALLHPFIHLYFISHHIYISMWDDIIQIVSQNNFLANYTNNVLIKLFPTVFCLFVCFPEKSEWWGKEVLFI